MIFLNKKNQVLWTDRESAGNTGNAKPSLRRSASQVSDGFRGFRDYFKYTFGNFGKVAFSSLAQGAKYIKAKGTRI